MYAGATVLVDQLLCGWYGGVAVEAMALGIPVVAYLNEKHLQEIPSAMRAEIPIVSATPETVGDVLAKLLQNRGWRRELSERGKSYVLRWHHPVKIARRMLEIYQDPTVMFWDGYDPDWNLG
jgi:glycosyltransferase involved in cell wall biosynthesis